MKFSAFISALALTLLAASVRAEPARSPFSHADFAAAVAAREPLETLLREVEHDHPIAMFFLAQRLFDAGRRDEATFWFYEGQVRWRPLLGDPARGDPDRFNDLFERIGPSINGWAMRDLRMYEATIDRVLSWDAAHPDDFTPPGPEKEKSRQGLKDLLAYTLAHADLLKRAHLAHPDNYADPTADEPYPGSGGAMMGRPVELVSDYDAKRFAQFKIGRTKKAEVANALGGPDQWETSPNGTSALSYSFIGPPVVAGLRERVLVVFRFDPAKTLTAVELP